MNNHYRGPSIDVSYQVSVHWAKHFQRRHFLEIDQSEKRIACSSHVFLANRNEMSILYRGHSIDAFYQMLVHFGKAISEEKISQKSTNQKQVLPVTAMFVNGSGQNELSIQKTFHRCILRSFGSLDKALSEAKFLQKSTNPKQVMFVNESGRNEQSLQRNFQGCFLTNVGAFGKAVSEQKLIKKSTNQKQELPVTAMFANGSERHEHSLQRTIHRCFLPSFGSFGKAVSEEKFFRNQPIRNKNCLWRPCLLTDHDEMSNIYRGPSQDASYQVSVHLAKRFQRRRFF